MATPGIFTISLDFELHWGTRDHRSLNQYGKNILGGIAAIPQILKLFQDSKIHATWATVGFMFYQNKEDLINDQPQEIPQYDHPSLNPYLAVQKLSQDLNPYYFSPQTIDLIQKTPGQEIATHTHSHYYCLESGQNKNTFKADLVKALEVAKRKNIKIQSLVFPRNQFNSEYLQVCQDVGLKTFRGNQNSWVYDPKSGDEESLFRRMVRLLDSYLNLTGHHGHQIQKQTLTNIPASRFLRPYSQRLKFLEPLRMKRIFKDMEYCAKHGLVYHLWWHPDNFGAQTEENLSVLSKIIQHFKKLEKTYGMKSMNMAEIADAK